MYELLGGSDLLIINIHIPSVATAGWSELPGGWALHLPLLPQQVNTRGQKEETWQRFSISRHPQVGYYL